MLTLRASLRADALWADAGHEVATGQWVVSPPAPASPRLRADVTAPTVGHARFGESGRLLELAGMPVAEARLGVWRAPIDNDFGYYGEPLEPHWRSIGLDRMQHRTESVAWTGQRLTVVTRSAPAASRLAIRTRWEWTTDGSSAELRLTATPVGNWTVPLPRLGIDLALPGHLHRVTWFGRGPGESYVDSFRSQLVGTYEATVDELQTPYLMPQENGNRSDVRWMQMAGPGAAIRVASIDGVFGFAARRWTAQQLDAARHPHDLAPGPHLWLSLDALQYGLGSASCGPGVHPRYVRMPEETTLSLRFEAP
jgi:beta-galactosidase